jgi:hypothetical protein
MRDAERLKMPYLITNVGVYHPSLLLRAFDLLCSLLLPSYPLGISYVLGILEVKGNALGLLHSVNIKRFVSIYQAEACSICLI